MRSRRPPWSAFSTGCLPRGRPRRVIDTGLRSTRCSTGRSGTVSLQQTRYEAWRSSRSQRAGCSISPRGRSGGPRGAPPGGDSGPGRPTLDARHGDCGPCSRCAFTRAPLDRAAHPRMAGRGLPDWPDHRAASQDGYARQIPMNSVVRSVLMDLAGQRQRPTTPRSPCSGAPTPSPTSSSRRPWSGRQERSKEPGRRRAGWRGIPGTATGTPSRAGWSWRGWICARPGRSGGWRTLAMVQRYSHLAPDHLQEAVERLVPGRQPPTALRENCRVRRPTPAGVL